MEAIEIMMSEHRTIESVIGALEAFVAEVLGGPGSPGDPAALARFVHVIRELADGHHHAKEEGQLFEAMVQAGFPRHAGPVGVMLQEHEQGRRHVAVLAALSLRPAPWSAEDRAALEGAALGYGRLLRAHIQKEDAILYPMARQRLSAAAARGVDEACARLDAAARDAGQLGALGALARALVERHPPVALRAAG
jgi:hemerythrin-like domain-containing protein